LEPPPTIIPLDYNVPEKEVVKMSNYTMVIPTYWGRAGSGLIADEKIVFDHPTSLDENGTLGRFLESLDLLDGATGIQVVVIPVANDPQVNEEVAAKVDEIIAPFRTGYDVVCFGHSQIEETKARLEKKGVSPKALELANLDNYSAVRNMCSLAGILTGREYTVFIDDDEVFVDPEFLTKVDESIAGIQALAGYYLQPDTYRLNTDNVPAWREPYWNNAVAMNEAFDAVIGTEPRVKPTPFVFGGNMTIALPLLMQVPFDPRITRGEDIDFLINLRINGVTFYLDRELSIKHLPPGSSRPSWKGIREDARRFLYERKKVRDHRSLDPDQLQPYPGLFLGEDLEERIIQTSLLLKKEYESLGDEEGVRECDANIALAENDPFQSFDTAVWLEELTGLWRELTAQAEGMGIPTD
jgi:hypothetical protein